MWIELQDIHKHYGPVKANNGVDLNVAAGCIHGILGENGAGKSTLMKVRAGFSQKTSGSILIDGKPVNSCVTLAAQTEPAVAPRYGLNSLSACLALAANSDIVTLAPQTSAELSNPNRRQRVIAADFDTNIDVQLVFVTVARHTPTPAVRAFRDAMTTQEAG